MTTAVLAAQIVVALGILNVWLLRAGRATVYRGGNARNMREEFTVYGLPGWALYVVGALKVALAVALVAGLWLPELTRPAALGMGALMLGAVAMHAKVRDPLQKGLPALTVLSLCVLVAAG